MKILHFFIRDLGGEFVPSRFPSAFEKLGELIKEGASRIYSEYFLAAGLAPVRFRIREQRVLAGGLPVKLTTHMKVFGYGVVLFDYLVEPESKDIAPVTLFSMKEFQLPDSRKISLDDLFKADLESAKPTLVANLQDEYQTPDFSDHFHLIIQNPDDLGTDQVQNVFAIGEDFENSPKRLFVKEIEFGTEQYKLYLMGRLGYLYYPMDMWDIANFVELSRVQLFELKVYDYILDQAIESTYKYLDELPQEESYLPLSWMRRSFKIQVRQILNLTKIRMDLVDLIKDITNTSKVTEDPFYENLYQELNDTFRIREWLKSVNDKVREIGDVQQIIMGRIDMSRSTALEMTIIILILIEIVMPLFKYLTS